MREVIPTPIPGLDLRREYGHHQSPAIRAGGMVFCSGMVAIDPQSGERQHGTVTSEARRIFENLKLLLESTGLSLDRLVQVHAMIYDRIEYDVLNRLYRRYVPNAPPARTVMSVQIEAGFKVMLDVIAAAEARQPAAMIYPRQVIEPGGWRRPGLPHSRAVRAGEFVFLSGMTATDPTTGTPARGTVAAETRRILFDAGIREHELGLSRVLPGRSAGADRLRRRAHWRPQGVSLKDLFAADGYPCFAGSSRRLPADPWEQDGPLVATLRRQLGVIMGKTHMVEFAFGGTGQNSHHGAPYNRWDAAAHRSVGSSSSGAGVSLLEGSALLAFGSDTAGSVRIPASMTGNAGLKVTIGRWSTGGVVPLSFTFDTPGLLARSVCDLAYGFAALDPAGIDPPALIAQAGTRDLAGIRIGVGDPFLWQDCDPGIAETVQDAVDTLFRAGAIARDFKLPEAEAAYDVFLAGGLSAIELRSFLDRELPEWLDQLDPVIAPAVRSAESLSALDYLARVVRLADLARTAAARLDAVDVTASPTLCLTPPLMSEVADADSHLRVNRRIVRNTAWVNYLGLCAITMPVARDRAGMPVGLQLTAPARAEEKLLTIALAVERLLSTRADRLGTAPLLAA